MTDLRKYLNEIDNAIFRPPGPVSVVQEITALQHVMAANHSNPAILVNKPKHADGRISDIPVLTNLFASRELSARALGIDDQFTGTRRSTFSRCRLCDSTRVTPGTTSRVDTSSHMTLTLA